MSTNTTYTNTQEQNQENQGNQKNKENSKTPDFRTFFRNYFLIFIFAICLGIVLFGSIGLYLSKISVADILPDDTDFEPFTSQKRYIPDAVIDMNILKDRDWFGLDFWNNTEKTFSQKAQFLGDEFLNSFDRSWIADLQRQALNPNNLGSNFILFLSKVFSETSARSFAMINNVFSLFEYLPEWLTMLLTSVFGIFIVFGLYAYNFVSSVFSHIINIGQYFRDSQWTDPNSWEHERSISFFRITKAIMFGCFWWWMSIITAIIVPVVATAYTLIAPLFAKYKILGQKDGRTHNLFSFIRDTFIFKQTFIIVLAIIALLNSMNVNFGGAYMIGALFAVILFVVFGKILNPFQSVFNMGAFNAENLAAMGMTSLSPSLSPSS